MVLGLLQRRLVVQVEQAIPHQQSQLKVRGTSIRRVTALMRSTLSRLAAAAVMAVLQWRVHFQEPLVVLALEPLQLVDQVGQVVQPVQ